MTVRQVYQSHRFVKRLLRHFPVAVVVTTLGIAQHYHKAGEKEAKHWEVTCYCSLPLRITSRIIGWVSNIEMPVSWRKCVYSEFASYFGVDIQEAASQDLTTYPSFCDFFCRALKDGVRPINLNECVVSPADGSVLTVGKVTSPRVEQVKGVTYSLEAFLGVPSWNKLFAEGKKLLEDQNYSGSKYINSLLKKKEHALYQYIVYLAPGDYHRFHSPVDWAVDFRRHFQGELLSVNPKIANWIPDLFSLNERVVYIGHWKHGFFSLTAVGATNVGSVHVYFDKTLKTNKRKWHCKVKHKDIFFPDHEEQIVKMNKGDLFGEFRTGSTIVLLFEAPSDFKFCVSQGDVIKVGESISDTGKKDSSF